MMRSKKFKLENNHESERGVASTSVRQVTMRKTKKNAQQQNDQLNFDGADLLIEERRRLAFKRLGAA